MASPGTASRGATPFSPQWLEATGKLLVDLILAQVALALGNISVLGIKPFAFLTQWGQDLQKKASDAYAQSQTAQATATTAQNNTNTLTDGLAAFFGQNPVGFNINDIGTLLDTQRHSFDQLLHALLVSVGLASVSITENNPAIVDLAGRAKSQSWGDDMDRATLSSNWTVLPGGAYQILDNDYVTGVTGGRAGIVYTGQTFVSAQHYAQVRVRSPNAGKAVLAIMSNTAGTSYCGLRYICGFFDNHLEIVSGSGLAAANMVVRASWGVPRNWNANDIIGIGYDPATKTYVGYLNDQPVLVWPDNGTTPVIPVGADNRSLMLITNVDASIFIGAGLDNIAAYDWT